MTAAPPPSGLPPLVVDLVVDAAPDHAFAVWVDRTALWWPPGHTISGDPQRVVFEPRAGGRIYEQGPDGAEHAWGEVVTWDPPHRLTYWWHLFFERSEATLVELTFTAADGGTRVRLEQTGWDALGEAGPPRRERTGAAWAHITERYRDAVRKPVQRAGGTP